MTILMFLIVAIEFSFILGEQTHLRQHEDHNPISNESNDKLSDISLEQKSIHSLSRDIEMKVQIQTRTATGGIIHRLLVFLSMLSFTGNACFLIYVFWLSK